nr:uncharacterized protein LOC123772089 [Procambarus clarkii]
MDTSDQSVFTELIGYSYDDNLFKGASQVKLADDPYFGSTFAPAITQFPELMASPDALLGLQMPQDLQEVVNTLLPEEDFPLGQYDTSTSLDMELGALSLWPDDDPLNLGTISPDEILQSPMSSAAASRPLQQDTRRRRKPKRSPKETTIDEPQTSSSSLMPSNPLFYPLPEDLGVTNPVSPLGESDTGSSSSEAGPRHRQRRPRVAYSTLTEEEKYKRIRDQNNVSSRLYRERHRHQLTNLQQDEQKLKERNQKLRAKVAGLEQLRDQMKEYTHTFLQQHMGAASINRKGQH